MIANARKAVLADFRKTLKDNSDPKRAAGEKAYLRSPLEFFGVPVPFVTKMAKAYKRQHKDAPRQEVLALSKGLWQSRYHQERTLAIKLIEQYPLFMDLSAMPQLEAMLSECTGWDHTDGIATHSVCEVLKKDKRGYAYLKRWAKSENLWLRRSALISQLPLFRRGLGDRGLFMKFARKMVSEKEFFIRKAIGWALRDISWSDPKEAFEYLMELKGMNASGLTLREGSKRLPVKMRDKVIIRNKGLKKDGK